MVMDKSDKEKSKIEAEKAPENSREDSQNKEIDIIIKKELISIGIRKISNGLKMDYCVKCLLLLVEKKKK